MNDEYICGINGGMAKIAMPKDCMGKKYKRTVWKTGRVVFDEVKL